jgi:hypothetical protein
LVILLLSKCGVAVAAVAGLVAAPLVQTSALAAAVVVLIPGQLLTVRLVHILFPLAQVGLAAQIRVPMARRVELQASLVPPPLTVVRLVQVLKLQREPRVQAARLARFHHLKAVMVRQAA